MKKSEFSNLGKLNLGELYSRNTLHSILEVRDVFPRRLRDFSNSISLCVTLDKTDKINDQKYGIKYI